jgi:hypothetical protein
MNNQFVISVISVPLAIWISRRFRVWLRHRSPAAGERGLFKERLPNWVKLVEGLILLVLLLPVSVGLFFASFTLHQLVHPNTQWGHASDIASNLLIIPILFISIPLAAVIANFISWLIPPVKRANELAMEGLPAASYTQLNRPFFTACLAYPLFLGGPFLWCD